MASLGAATTRVAPSKALVTVSDEPRSTNGDTLQSNTWEKEVLGGATRSGWEGTKEAARAGYQRLVAQHTKELNEKNGLIEALQEKLNQTAIGGAQFAELQQAYDATQGEVRSLQSKVKSLVKLLDRAGATLRQERVGKGRAVDANGGGDLAVATQRLDWSPISQVMRDLNIRDQSDEQILASIVRYIKKLSGQVGALEGTLESSSTKVAELEGKKETLLVAIQNYKSDIDELHSEIAHLKKSAYGDEGEAATLRQELESEKARMLHQITTLETAMRNNVEAKPFFVAMGKAVSVPPFLRYDGRIRNVGMSKRALESIINAMWVTRFEPVLGKCAAIRNAELLPEQRSGSLSGAGVVRSFLDAFERANLSTAMEHMFVMEKIANSVLSGAERAMLVDYNNLSLWEYRRGDARKFLSFHDHVARFLIEMVKPDKIPLVFNQYSKGDGLSTPPMAEVARNARTTLLMCAPQQNTIMRPAAAMPVEVAEISYSLVDGCDRFSFDADVELFRRISKGQLPESTFFDQMIMLQKLKVALSFSASIEREEARDAAGLEDSLSSTGSGDGGEERLRAVKPSVQSILRMLRKFFPAKTQEEFRLLQRALLLDVQAITLDSEEAAVLKGGLEGTGTVSAQQMALTVDVPKLFASNDSGNQGYFLECVRNQHVESVTTYMAEVQHAILSLLKSDANHTTHAGGIPGLHSTNTKVQPGMATILSIRDKLLEIDPSKPLADVHTHLYHLLQLMYLDRFRMNAPDADLVHQSSDDWFEPPLCNHVVSVEEISKYCPVVLAKRCGPSAAPVPHGRPTELQM